MQAKDRKATLRAVSLASRSMAKVAQARLLQRVGLNSWEQLASFVWQVDEEKKRRVRELEWTSPSEIGYGPTDYGAFLFPLLDHLTFLCLVDANPRDLPSPADLPSLAHLRLSEYYSAEVGMPKHTGSLSLRTLRVDYRGNWEGAHVITWLINASRSNLREVTLIIADVEAAGLIFSGTGEVGIERIQLELQPIEGDVDQWRPLAFGGKYEEELSRTLIEIIERPTLRQSDLQPYHFSATARPLSDALPHACPRLKLTLRGGSQRRWEWMAKVGEFLILGLGRHARTSRRQADLRLAGFLMCASFSSSPLAFANLVADGPLKLSSFILSFL